MLQNKIELQFYDTFDVCKTAFSCRKLISFEKALWFIWANRNYVEFLNQ